MLQHPLGKFGVVWITGRPARSTLVRSVKHVLNLGPFCRFDTVSVIGGIWIFMASFDHIVLISTESYIFIKLPLRYKEIVSEKIVTTGVLTAWAVPTIVIATMIILVSSTGGSDMYLTLLTATDLLMCFIFLAYITVTINIHIFIFLQARNHRRRLPCKQLSRRSSKTTLYKQQGSHNPDNHYSSSDVFIFVCNRAFLFRFVFKWLSRASRFVGCCYQDDILSFRLAHSLTR